MGDEKNKVRLLVETGVVIGPMERRNAIPASSPFLTLEGLFYKDVEKKEVKIPAYLSEAEKRKLKQQAEQNVPIDERQRAELKSRDPELYALSEAFYHRVARALKDERDRRNKIADAVKINNLNKDVAQEMLQNAEVFTINSLPGLDSKYGIFQVWRPDEEKIRMATPNELFLYLAYGMACGKWTLEDAIFRVVTECSITKFHSTK